MLKLVGRTSAAVGHASSQQGDQEAQDASQDGDQGEGTSRLDVGGHRV